RHVDQHAVSARGPMHAEPLEDLGGARDRLAGASVIEMNADLRRRAALRLGDRVPHRFEVRIAHELTNPARMPSHHQSPLAPPPPNLPPPPLNPRPQPPRPAHPPPAHPRPPT